LTFNAWQPGAGRRMLAARAAMLAQIRAFFAARDVLEVETPLLCSSPATDPSLSPLRCGDRWLQTSPEYAMKRLLAAGSGPIYQICKAFRGGEAGPRHNPEFTMLEWYRPGLTLSGLVEEVAELVGGILDQPSCDEVSYADLFARYLDIDPHGASCAELESCARAHVDFHGAAGSRDTWLDLLLTHVIQPRLRDTGMVFVRDYPASQAALARVFRRGSVAVADRFELFVDGVELANGYCELTDPVEQRRRFEADNAALTARGEPTRDVDERFLSALDAGLPDCTGVALGIDRLLMLRMGIDTIAGAIGFDWSRS
jgi:lysyl-tRNA synthetase class 2